MTAQSAFPPPDRHGNPTVYDGRNDEGERGEVHAGADRGGVLPASLAGDRQAAEPPSSCALVDPSPADLALQPHAPVDRAHMTDGGGA